MRTDSSGSVSPARYFRRASCLMARRFALNTSGLSLLSPWKWSSKDSLLIAHRTRVSPSCPQNRTVPRSKIIPLFRHRKSQIASFNGPPHALRHERGERFYIHIDAGAVQRPKVGGTILDADDRPGI